MKAEELDQKFDEGEEVLQYFDLNSVKRPGLEIKPVNVDFPILIDVYSCHSAKLVSNLWFSIGVRTATRKKRSPSSGKLRQSRIKI